MAKAAYWTITDAEARKRGEQTGLDTLVVHAVNAVSYTHLYMMQHRMQHMSLSVSIQSHIL